MGEKLWCNYKSHRLYIKVHGFGSIDNTGSKNEIGPVFEAKIVVVIAHVYTQVWMISCVHHHCMSLLNDSTGDLYLDF